MQAKESKWTTSSINDLVQATVEARYNDYRKQAIIHGGSTLIFWDSINMEERELLNKHHEEYTQRVGMVEEGDLKKWLESTLESIERKFPRGE